jgi:hypothetical protein
MEGGSQDEDSSLRDYWTKKREKKKKRKERKKEGDRRSVSGETESTDHEGQDMHEGNTLDSTKLTTLTSANEDTLQNENQTSSTSEEMPSSPLSLYTSHLELQNNDEDSDDVLLDFNEFTSPARNSPEPLQTSHDEDVNMEGAASPNQAKSSGPETSVEQASSSVPENNSNSPAQGSSGDQIQPAINANNTSLALPQDNTSLALPQDNTSLALPQANTSILTVDVVNDIHCQRRQINISYT